MKKQDESWQDMDCTYNPPAADGGAKRARFEMRAEFSDLAQWQAAADACGLSLSEWMRETASRAATGARERSPRPRPVDVTPPAVLQMLLKIGANVNQQAHALNTIALKDGAKPPRVITDQIAATLAELSAAVSVIKEAWDSR